MRYFQFNYYYQQYRQSSKVLRNPMTTCPLCLNDRICDYWEDKVRCYLHCPCCDLVFVPEEYLLSAADEKAEYDKHENTLDDPGYLKFLSRTYQHILQRTPKGSCGLDYGCGPAPALAHFLSHHERQMSVFDIFYAPDESVFQHTYDFITCTEVIEHIVNTHDTILHWLQMLDKSSGLIAIMTKRVTELDAFKQWHYKNDPTHIRFFSRSTFEWIAEHWSLTADFPEKDVVLLSRN
ncbi:class I SAM-dependent methyltransferase [Pleionea sediminis]|uniref:class I SAM-dependent methyltransferase n=1 Tax=Pleionea sediminis TaxID=2569479 RepID=UPI00197C1347|nr:class I SAM-dependent methyltransferase [Pleionea sediminis]